MKFKKFNTILKRGISLLAVTAVISSGIMCNTISAKAAYYTVTPEVGTLLAGNGAEVFADADASTYVTSLAGNTPVQVTGRTNNGFWQIAMNNSTYYVSQQALSATPNTTAYRLATYDVSGALVANAATGKIIYSQAATDKLEPASTTKIMTALLTIEAIEAGQFTLQTPVAVSATAVASLPSDASHVNPRLQAGEVLTVEQLLSAVMISSDCQACNVLAELIAGSVPNFAALMNTRAAQIGCVNTNFTNPSGYPDKNMYTNPYSLYLITATAIKHPMFNQFFGMASTTLPATNLCPAPRALVNTDALMIPGSAYYNPSVIGGKTGTANRAGQCLVTVAQKEGKTVISVVQGGRNRLMTDGTTKSTRYTETNRLLELGFANYW
ncbi:MAG: serine hydrolase [Pseudobutyrivibrio sp.]|nr:serine hydrolase [Pseudobutyrivibrio sp.]